MWSLDPWICLVVTAHRAMRMIIGINEENIWSRDCFGLSDKKHACKHKQHEQPHPVFSTIHDSLSLMRSAAFVVSILFLF
jgi:hypothetical protein